MSNDGLSEDIHSNCMIWDKSFDKGDIFLTDVPFHLDYTRCDVKICHKSSDPWQDIPKEQLIAYYDNTDNKYNLAIYFDKDTHIDMIAWRIRL